jgi:hypothetical protein
VKRLALLAVLLVAGPLFAQDVPLIPAGDGVRTVIVATKFPFTVSAPPGAAIYVWQVPAGVVFTGADDTITVTDAPPGECVVGVMMVAVDFDAKKIVKKSGRVTLSVGEVTPPDPATSALTRNLRSAYATETDASKAAQLVKLTAFWKAASTALDDQSITTTAALLADLLTVRRSMVADAQLRKVRDVIDPELVGLFGPESVPLDAALRAKAKPVFKRIYSALTYVK